MDPSTLETWRNPADEGSRRVPGFGRARLMRSSAQPLAPQHLSGALAVQVRVNPKSADPVQHVPTHSRHARAVLELSHGDPWLSSPLWRRGAHVVTGCDLNTALLVSEWTSAVLNLIALRRIWHLHAIGTLSRLRLSYGSCLLIRDTTFFTLKVSLPRTYVVLDKVLSILCPLVSFSQLMSGKQAVGEVACANQMFTNLNRLIVLDQIGLNRQNQIQDTMSSFSVANWVSVGFQRNSSCWLVFLCST